MQHIYIFTYLFCKMLCSICRYSQKLGVGSIVLGFGNGFLQITSAELYKLVGISFSDFSSVSGICFYGKTRFFSTE